MIYRQTTRAGFSGLGDVPLWLQGFVGADGSIDPAIALNLRAAPLNETAAQKAANLAKWPRTDKYSTPAADPACITDWNVFQSLNASNPGCAVYYSPHPGRPCDTAMDCPPIKNLPAAAPIPVTPADEGWLDTNTGILSIPTGTPGQTTQVQYLQPSPPNTVAAPAPTNTTQIPPNAPNTVAAPTSGTGPLGIPLPAWMLNTTSLPVLGATPNWELLAAGGLFLALLMMRHRHR